MKLLQITPFVSPRFGGPPVVVSAYGEHLARLGLNVTTLATAEDREILDVQESGLFEGALRSGKLMCLRRCWPRGWFNAEKLAAGTAHAVAKADLCHLHMLWDRPHVLAARCAVKAKRPYAITPHGLLKPWSMRQKRAKKRAFMTLLGNRMLREAACLHALCESEVNSFRQVGYRGPVCVVPNGVDTSLVTMDRAPTEHDLATWADLRHGKVVLFLSRLDREKGLDVLLGAWRHVVAHEPDALLVIAGPDNRGYGETVKDIICHMDLCTSVKLVGPVYGDCKWALMRMASIFVLPSYSEGFSIALLEALAMGLPCLVTPGCNFAEASDCGAALLAEPSPGALSEGLTHLLRSTEQQRIRMGEAGRRLVRDGYTWDIAAQKMATVYSHILDGKKIAVYPERKRSQGDFLR